MATPLDAAFFKEGHFVKFVLQLGWPSSDINEQIIIFTQSNSVDNAIKITCKRRQNAGKSIPILPDCVSERSDKVPSSPLMHDPLWEATRTVYAKYSSR